MGQTKGGRDKNAKLWSYYQKYLNWDVVTSDSGHTMAIIYNNNAACINTKL